MMNPQTAFVSMVCVCLIFDVLLMAGLFAPEGRMQARHGHAGNEPHM